HIGRPALD
ncbi:hypothetical protein D021_4225B, partial [Vibrio parahaemolyticus 10296]